MAIEARVAQAGAIALAGEVPPVRVAQAGVIALLATGTPVRVAQAGIAALVAIRPEVRIPQAGLIMLAAGSPCTTRWAQVWTIERLDGEVFRFTSLDRDLDWLGETYRSCDSLVPSASEAVS